MNGPHPRLFRGRTPKRSQKRAAALNNAPSRSGERPTAQRCEAPEGNATRPLLPELAYIMISPTVSGMMPGAARIHPSAVVTSP